MEKILKWFSVLLLCFLNFSVRAEHNTLRIPLQTSLISLDPSHIQDVPSLFVSRQISCQLVRNEGSVFNLDAAKSIKYISSLEIMVSLNENTKFHDGSPVTADDVVASFEYVKKSRNIMRNIFSWVDQIVVSDERTIIFYLKKPVPQFLKVLSSPNYAIFKKDFIEQASKNHSLWREPLGCGGYKIVSSNNQEIRLQPVKEGMPIIFYLNKKNQVLAEDVDKYDIISLSVFGSSNKINNFNVFELLDPLQVFVGLNLNQKIWKNRSSRCVFLSKLDTNELIRSYDGAGKKPNDLLPQGTLGYSSEINYSKNIKEQYQNKVLPKIEKFCLAYLAVSIPEKYRDEYFRLIKKLYPNIEVKPITDAKQFGMSFSKQHCHAILFALKSNYLDGYEFFQIFANNEANFSSLTNDKLLDDIQNSQNFVDPYERVKTYRSIISQIENACIILPIVTIPMRKIYVRKILNTPGIGLGALNEYYLGNVTDLSHVQK